MEKRTTPLLQNFMFEASRYFIEEWEKTNLLERESLLSDREQLQSRVDQLEVILAFEREEHEQEKEKAEENTTALLQKIARLEASLNEKHEKTLVPERDSLLIDGEQLLKCFGQLEAALASEREQREQKKEKIKEKTNALLKNIIRLEDSMKVFDERDQEHEKTKQDASNKNTASDMNSNECYGREHEEDETGGSDHSEEEESDEVDHDGEPDDEVCRRPLWVKTSMFMPVLDECVIKRDESVLSRRDWSPLQYFQQYIDEKLIKDLSMFTNQRMVQDTVCSLKTTPEFFGWRNHKL
ncbi:hypothetical protein KOW79_003107 [Hemibagrus wyckioides]|uniref:Uncharacterized protein n=1 Tax=Hemibagrus wyckioides TaxID=337641 RepID=A0A9D3P5Q4_9TELE|nr:hypothetical protein KOW79_003107 [Hemibagrus wyckioides]